MIALPAGLAGTAAAAAIVSAVLIRLLRPLLGRYALARPNARSSHRVPTPQGGGLAVLAGALLAGAGGIWLDDVTVGPDVLVACLAAALLAATGAWDDISPLSPFVRAAIQAGCVVGVLLAMPPGILPDGVPRPLALTALALGGVWWVNAVNFMDGIDWITLAELVPMTAALALFGLAGHLPPDQSLAAAALCGGLLGFAPANRPPARLFLGDVGSLPLGLLTGWLLLALASHGAVAAALLMPLYYVADATLTLGRRLLRGERVWEAHRQHAYQRAVDRGVPVLTVDGRILALNIALAGLAVATLLWPSALVQVVALSLGTALVGWTMRRLVPPGSPSC